MVLIQFYFHHVEVFINIALPVLLHLITYHWLFFYNQKNIIVTVLYLFSVKYQHSFTSITPLTNLWLLFCYRRHIVVTLLYLFSVDYQHSHTSITPLMIAAGRGFTSVVEQLLNLGANINVKASNDWTALYLAQKFKHEDICELLEANM